MHRLGHTRSAHKPDHLLHTPDTFVRAPLPGMEQATAIVHIAPAGGAMFTQYTVEFDAKGRLAPSPAQRFLYVLEGTVDVDRQPLTPGGFVYLPPEHDARIVAPGRARAAVIEKPY